MRHATLAMVGLFVMLSSISGLRGDEKRGAAVAAAAPKPAISIGEMRIQTIPAMPYLCTPAETTFAKMGEPVKAGFDRVFGAALAAKLFIVRPTMLVYQGNPHFHPQESFKMEIGVIVADDAKIDAVDDLKIRKTEPLKVRDDPLHRPGERAGPGLPKADPRDEGRRPRAQR